MKSLLTTPKVKAMVHLLALCALVIFTLGADAYAPTMPPDVLESIAENYPDGLPRYMTPEEQQWLDEQKGIEALAAPEFAPLAAPIGTVWTPGEYEALYGPFVAWEPGSYLSLLTDFIVGVTTDPNMDSIAFVIVSGASQEASCTSTLLSHVPPADMDRVKFIYYNLDTVWIRDYGPRYVYEDGNPVINDHTYNRPRYNDNDFPAFVSTYDVPFDFDEPVYLMDLTHGGGNFHAVSSGDAFMSTLIEEENSGKTTQQITDIIEDHHNVNLTIYPRLSSYVDATGHIDMWFLPLSDNKILISEFQSDHPTSKSRTDAAAADLTSRGYTVYRTPAYNSNGEGSSGGTHYTYTNAAIVNNRVFVPWYNHTADDAAALATFQTAMPNHEIIQVDCTSIISAAGAIHCVMKHVYAQETPFGEILTANGGETWRVGEQHEIKWIAIDDMDGGITSVDIYYSTDGGSTFPNTIATGETHDGKFTWTIPDTISDLCRIKVVVHDGDLNSYEDTSDADFTIAAALPPPIVYDYTGITSPSGTHTAEDGEIDVADSMIENGTFPARRGTGITSWAEWAEATTAEYAALVGSDDNRYQGADPGSGDNAAMIFEFYVSENPADVEQIDVSVELGRASSTDLGWFYIWNYNTSSYLVLGSQSGTSDQVLTASIDTNPEDYIESGTGQLTVFVVNEDVSDYIRVDDISVTIYAQTAPPEYTLTINITGDGSVTKVPDQATYTYGTVVTLTADPNVGWSFYEWSDDLTGTTNPDTITMDGNKTVTATFTQDQYTLTINITGDGSVTKVPDQATYTYGTVVTLTADPNVGWSFYEWSDDLTGTTNPDTITMDGNKTVTATFTQDQYTLTINITGDGSVTKVPDQATYTYGTVVTLTADPNVGWSFYEWSDDLTGTTNPDTITMDGNKTVTATFTQDQYTLTINITGDGSVTKVPDQATYTYGTVVTLTADPNVGWSFYEWSDDLTGTTNPDTITMDGNKTVTATFTEDQYTLTINTVGSGSVAKVPDQATYTYGTVVTLTADPNVGWSFNSWSGDMAGSTNPDTITMDGNKTVTATFTEDQYTLTINTVGSGSVAKVPDQATYTYGTVVTLTADPNTGWSFNSWSGDMAGSTNPDTITMDGNKTVTATFTQDQYTLTINITGDGSVTKVPDQATYTYGTVVTLTADPNVGWSFYEWSDDLTGTTNPDTITMDGNKTVTATFTQDQYTLTINITGDGSVTKVPDQATYTYGTVVTLTADPNVGWSFYEWSDDLTGTTNPDTITMDGNKTVTATFTQDQYTLTINITGDGSVTKVPDQATYTYGTVVTLTADPNVGWSFYEWSDDLTGTTNPETITMDGNKTVTATFTEDQYTLTINTVGSGSVAKVPDQATYTYGTVVTLTADPNTGWSFNSWSGDMAGSTNPDTITMDGNKSVTATFTEDQYTLTINTVGSGSVAKVPDQATYTYGTVVTLTADPNTGWSFNSWSGDMAGSTNPDTITMNGNKSVTANFAINQYAISGSVGTLDGVTMNGLPGDPVTSGGGLYSATVNYGWSGTVTPSRTGCTFLPANREYTSVQEDHTGDNYTATLNTYIISGDIFEPDGKTPVEDVLVETDDDVNSVTDANGYYELPVYHGWSGTISPQKEGWTFDPCSDDFENVVSNIFDMNYTATMITFTISGHIVEEYDLITPINDVNLTAENGGGYYTNKYGSGSDITDVNGYYEIVVDYNFSGTVLPQKYAYGFKPKYGRDYINVRSDSNDQDYLGALLTFSISGHIDDPNGRAMVDVLVDTDNGGGGFDTTDANGYYEVWVDHDWSGTVTPEKQGYYFDPNQDVYTNVLEDYNDIDYMGIRNEDLNVDGFIDEIDLGYLIDYWLVEDPPYGDFYEDSFIDFRDFAQLANVWLIDEY